MIALCPLGDWQGSSWELRSQKRDELAAPVFVPVVIERRPGRRSVHRDIEDVARFFPVDVVERWLSIVQKMTALAVEIGAKQGPWLCALEAERALVNGLAARQGKEAA